MIVLGLGLSLTVAPLTSTVLGAIDEHRSGLARTRRRPIGEHMTESGVFREVDKIVEVGAARISWARAPDAAAYERSRVMRRVIFTRERTARHQLSQC